MLLRVYIFLFVQKRIESVLANVRDQINCSVVALLVLRETEFAQMIQGIDRWTSSP